MWEQFVKNEKKEAVIETARDLFAHFGFGKTTIDDIARKSFVAKSTIYNYFNSKEEIFDEVIAQEGNILTNEISKAVNSAVEPVEKIRLYATTRMRHIRKLKNLYSALTDEYLKHFSFIEKARKKGLENEIRTLKEILKEGIEKGVFDVKDIDLTSFAIITSWRGMDFPWTETVEIPNNEETINYLLEVLFNGIRKR